MPWGAAIAAGGAVLGSVLGGNAQKKAAETASNAQIQAAQVGVDEQRRQFDALQKVLSPYVTAGTGALGAYQNLLGLGGAGSQQSAISALEASPEFAALQKQGENALLANASATGGLRGGNTQSALAQFRPALLSQLINEQYGRLGGLTSLGQNAAAGVGNAGIQTGQGISQLLQQMGSAQAGNALAAGKANSALYGNLGQLAGQIGGMYSSGAFNGGGGGGMPTNEVF